MLNPKKCSASLVPYRNGLVLKGYDLVEYFNKAGLKTADPVFVKGTLGNNKFAAKIIRNKAEYVFWFINSENLKKFISDPVRYMPQYGGFCSWGIANEYNKDTVPPNCGLNCQISNDWVWSKYIMGPPGEPSNGATVYRGKLYLNYWFPGGSDIKRCFFYQKSNNSSKTGCAVSLPKTKFPTEKDTNNYIRRANSRWKNYYGSLNSGPLNVRCYPGNIGPGISDRGCLELTPNEKKCLLVNKLR